MSKQNQNQKKQNKKKNGEPLLFIMKKYTIYKWKH